VPTPMTLDVTILLCAHARHPHSPDVLAEAIKHPMPLVPCSLVRSVFIAG